jgi:hypothetical protein
VLHLVGAAVVSIEECGLISQRYIDFFMLAIAKKKENMYG